MNGFTNAILTVLLGWLRSLFATLWTLLGSDGGNAVLTFLRTNWKTLFLILCVGGFVVDRIIYLLRWRPYYVWQARRARRRQGWEDEPEGGYAPPHNGYDPREQHPAYMEEYDQPESGPWQPQPTARYQPRQAQAHDAPTYRYSPPSRQPVAPYPQGQRFEPAPAQPYNQPPMQAAPPVSVGEPPPYTPGASYAPTAAYQPVYIPLPSEPEGEDLRFDEDLAAWNAPKNVFDGFAPRLTPENNPAYGMDSTFGAPQPEPAQYLRDVQAGFAPQPTPEQRYAPPSIPAEPTVPQAGSLRADHPGLDVETIQQNIGLTGDRMPSDGSPRVEEDRAGFSPFATVTPQEASLNRPRGLGALAKKARSFVSGEDERNPLTIRDLQPATDMRSAFRAPVYPQKAPGSEDDA